MDSEKFEEIKKLTAFARKNGIESLKIDGIELKFNASALFPESAYKQKKSEASEEAKTENPYSEEDLLFWSAQGIPGDIN